MGLQYMFIWIEALEKRVFCWGSFEKRQGTEFDLLYIQFEKLDDRKRNFLLYLVLFDELLLRLGRRNGNNLDLFPFRTEMLIL